MTRYKTFCLVAIAAALTVAPLVNGAAWAKKAHQQQQQAAAASYTNSKCNGGVSKGCGPGACRCP